MFLLPIVLFDATTNDSTLVVPRLLNGSYVIDSLASLEVPDLGKVWRRERRRRRRGTVGEDVHCDDSDVARERF